MNVPEAPGRSDASEETPLAKVIYEPLTNLVSVFVSPLQFILKIKLILTKSARLAPIFLISPEKILLPELSVVSRIFPTNTQLALTADGEGRSGSSTGETASAVGAETGREERGAVVPERLSDGVAGILSTIRTISLLLMTRYPISV